jgi:hypothetical protein
MSVIVEQWGLRFRFLRTFSGGVMRFNRFLFGVIFLSAAVIGDDLRAAELPPVPQATVTAAPPLAPAPNIALPIVPPTDAQRLDLPLRPAPPNVELPIIIAKPDGSSGITSDSAKSASPERPKGGAN